MDSAFPVAFFPGFTTPELREILHKCEFNHEPLDKVRADGIRAEIARRAKVAAGDVSVMTPGERLRHVRKMEAAK